MKSSLPVLTPTPHTVQLSALEDAISAATERVSIYRLRSDTLRDERNGAARTAELSLSADAAQTYIAAAQRWVVWPDLRAARAELRLLTALYTAAPVHGASGERPIIGKDGPPGAHVSCPTHAIWRSLLPMDRAPVYVGEGFHTGERFTQTFKVQIADGAGAVPAGVYAGYEVYITVSGDVDGRGIGEVVSAFHTPPRAYQFGCAPIFEAGDGLDRLNVFDRALIRATGTDMAAVARMVAGMPEGAWWPDRLPFDAWDWQQARAVVMRGIGNTTQDRRAPLVRALARATGRPWTDFVVVMRDAEAPAQGVDEPRLGGA